MDLREAVKSAKQKQQDAKDECKKLERDMGEFKNNKDSKLKELKGDIASQRSALSKEAAALKSLQKDMQTAILELGGSVICDSHPLPLSPNPRANGEGY